MKRDILLILLILLLSFTFRVVNFRAVFDREGVTFPDTDPYYHMRRIQFCYQNYPFLNDFDASMNYPRGARVPYEPGFDLLIATFAKIVSVFHPLDRGGVEVVSAIAIPLLGVVNVLFIYFFTRALFDRKTALLSSLLVAMLPANTVFTKLGKVDHHSIESLLLIISLFPIFYAERFRLSEMRRGLAHIVSGFLFGISLYFLRIVVLPLMALAIFLITKSLLRRDGNGALYLVLTLVSTSLISTPFILKSPFVKDGIFTYFSLSPFHLYFVSLLSGMSVILFIVNRSRFTENRGHFLRISTFLLLSLIHALLLERLSKGRLFENLFMGFGFLSRRNPFVATVSEQMPLFWGDGSFSLTYPIFFYTPLLFLLPFLVLYLFKTKSMDIRGLVPQLLFWSLFTFVLSFLQLRYAVFFCPFYAILLSYGTFSFLGNLYEFQKPSLRRVGVAAIFIAYSASSVQLMRYYAAESRGDVQAKGVREVMRYLKEETPSSDRDFLTPPFFKRPSYGILAPWDMGHWIIYRGERPNVANPFGIEWFYEGVERVSTFFLEEDEDRACALLKKDGVEYVISRGETWYIRHSARYLGLREEDFKPDIVEKKGSGDEGKGEETGEMMITEKNIHIMKTMGFRMGILCGKGLKVGRKVDIPALKRFEKVFTAGEERRVYVGGVLLKYPDFTIFRCRGDCESG